LNSRGFSPNRGEKRACRINTLRTISQPDFRRHRHRRRLRRRRSSEGRADEAEARRTGRLLYENDPILKMAERPDWTLFRSIEGLCQKAGVPNRSLRRLVMKEIGDNALDTGADIRFGLVDADSPDLFFVEDDGPGLDGTPEEIASLFSISRPLRSSKLLRLPQRGALGGGQLGAVHMSAPPSMADEKLAPELAPHCRGADDFAWYSQVQLALLTH
jgi:hypothetical protein